MGSDKESTQTRTSSAAAVKASNAFFKGGCIETTLEESRVRYRRLLTQSGVHLISCCSDRSRNFLARFRKVQDINVEVFRAVSSPHAAEVMKNTIEDLSQRFK